ncbi:MAG TPA: MoaD/ThiS family protein [Phototrophicaceae bacterium]|nr:MoaD/ThiS family protein [Phototrophicaceae bacterium]
MAQVRFTSHLKRFFPDLKTYEAVEGRTVAEVVAGLEARHPGLASYLVDERGALRQHVNIFIGDTLISDKQTLQDPVSGTTTLFIIQALSGG